MTYGQYFFGALLIGAVVAGLTLGVTEAAIAVAESVNYSAGKAVLFRAWGGSAILTAIGGMVGFVGALRFGRDQ